MKRWIIAGATLAISTLPASAHLLPGDTGSFLTGLAHPLTGLDHMMAMVMVGVWGALLGGRAVWLVPSAFVATMMAGFILAVLGVELPFVEPMIQASIVVIALLVALALPVPPAVAMVIVAAFALFHGFAHGTEVGASSHAPFASGFALGTAILHALGLALGLAARYGLGAATGKLALRFVGGAGVIGGLAFALNP